MKQSILLIAIFLTSFSFSQDSTKTKKPITSKVYFGESINVENYKIEFIDVVQDSRCPKGVSCIWAGEVVILVDLFEDGKKIKRKKITLNPKIGLQNSTGNLFISDKLRFSVSNILPHPVVNEKTQLNNYYLILDTSY